MPTLLCVRAHACIKKRFLNKKKWKSYFNFLFELFESQLSKFLLEQEHRSRLLHLTTVFPNLTAQRSWEKITTKNLL